MSVEIQGLNTLIKKLDKLSRIESKKIVEEVAGEVLDAIKTKGTKISDAGNYAGKIEVRDYGKSYFLDVGFSSNEVDFELWKHLWFHHWGYFNNGWYFKGQYYIANHQMWFDEAVKSIESKAVRQIKTKLKEEVRNCMR